MGIRKLTEITEKVKEAVDGSIRANLSGQGQNRKEEDEKVIDILDSKNAEIAMSDI